jgi:hypothetical protein
MVVLTAAATDILMVLKKAGDLGLCWEAKTVDQ